MRDDCTELILKGPSMQSCGGCGWGVLKAWQQDARVRDDWGVILAQLSPFTKSIQLKDHSTRSALKSREPIPGLVLPCMYKTLDCEARGGLCGLS